jgi:hypothetical protein
MLVEIQRRVPEFDRPSDETYVKVLRRVIEEAVHGFLDRVENPDRPGDTETFRNIGRSEAAEGRDLAPFQAAMRLGARVAWRRLTQECQPRGLDPQTLYDLGEAIFVYLDQLADAAAAGYAEARAHAAGDLERRRTRLLDLLLSGTAPIEVIEEQAQAAGWPLSAAAACVALEEPNGNYRSPLLPSDVLCGLERGVPCLIVPDPSPERIAAVEQALRGWRAALGPAVPMEKAATSLRWAVEALRLSARGVITGTGLVRCADHMTTLVVFKDEELIAALAEIRLAPFADLRPNQQDRLAETLLAWLRYGRGAAEVAAHLHVHPQTVRYRLRQLEELYGEQLTDPEIRFQLEIVLRARQAAR